MQCATVQTIVTCGNTGGNNCTGKQQVNVLAMTTSNSCSDQQLSVLTGSEVRALQTQSSQNSPFALSLSEGSIIGASIILVWATAWGIKAMVRTIGSGEPER
jgi:hypothetical protein